MDLKNITDAELSAKIAEFGAVASERDPKGGITEKAGKAIKDRLPYIRESQRRKRERAKQKQAEDARTIAEKFEADRKRIQDLKTLGVKSI